MLIAVAVVVASVKLNSFGKSCVVLMESGNIIICIESSISGKSAEENILAVERIIVAKIENSGNFLVSHIAYRKSVRILIYFKVRMYIVVIRIILSKDLVIISVKDSVVACLTIVVNNVLDSEEGISKIGISVISCNIASHGISHCFKEIDSPCIHNGA